MTVETRNVHTTDEVVGHAAWNGRVHPPVTIRRAYEDDTFIGAQLFVGGWRTGTYKTEAGVRSAATKACVPTEEGQ